MRSTRAKEFTVSAHFPHKFITIMCHSVIYSLNLKSSVREWPDADVVWPQLLGRWQCQVQIASENEHIAFFVVHIIIASAEPVDTFPFQSYDDRSINLEFPGSKPRATRPQRSSSFLVNTFSFIAFGRLLFSSATKTHDFPFL